jgi:DNA-binding NarL/FixJ family response regulator
MDPNGHRVLLVEDEALVARSLMMVLRPFDPIHVSDVAAVTPALATLAPVACVISDLGIPGGGGEAVWDAVEEHRPDLVSRFRVLTGGGSSENRYARFLNDKKPMILYKPVDPSELRALVKKWLEDDSEPS